MAKATTKAASKAASKPEATPATGTTQTAPAPAEEKGTEESAPEAGTGEATQVTVDGDPVLPPAVVKDVVEDAVKAATQTLTADDDTTRETVIAPTGAADEKEEAEPDTEWLAEKIGPYLEAYPEETVFHVTSDGQVFLGKDFTFAKEHQATINDGGDLYTFRVQS